MNLSTEEKQREQTYDYQGGGNDVEGMEQEFSISRCKIHTFLWTQTSM